MGRWTFIWMLFLCNMLSCFQIFLLILDFHHIGVQVKSKLLQGLRLHFAEQRIHLLKQKIISFIDLKLQQHRYLKFEMNKKNHFQWRFVTINNNDAWHSWNSFTGSDVKFLRDNYPLWNIFQGHRKPSFLSAGLPGWAVCVCRQLRENNWRQRRYWF